MVRGFCVKRSLRSYIDLNSSNICVIWYWTTSSHAWSKFYWGAWFANPFLATLAISSLAVSILHTRCAIAVFSSLVYASLNRLVCSAYGRRHLSDCDAAGVSVHCCQKCHLQTISFPNVYSGMGNFSSLRCRRSGGGRGSWRAGRKTRKKEWVEGYLYLPQPIKCFLSPTPSSLPITSATQATTYHTSLLPDIKFDGAN